MSATAARRAVYVGLDDQAICALDAQDGSLIWRQALEASPSFPIITEAAVYATTVAGTIHGWQRTDGAPLWTQAATAPFPSPPAHTAGRVCVSSHDGELRAYDAESGVLVWRQAVAGLLPVQPLARDGRVYVATESGDVAAFSAADGAALWYAPRLGDPGTTKLAATASVLIARSAHGTLVAVHADDGGAIWRHHAGYVGLSRPTMDDEKLYVASHQDMGRWTVRALQVSDGAVAWEAQPRLGGHSTSESVGGRLFVAVAHSGVFGVQAYEATNGREIWRWETTGAGGGITAPTATRDTVYISVGMHGVYALGATDGKPLWQTLQGAMGSAVAAF